MKPIASAAIQYLFVKFEGSKIFAAVMPYTKGYGTKEARTRTHIPVETVESDETIQLALRRGAVDEAAKDRTRFDFDLGKRFHVELAPDQKHPGFLHLKIAYEMTATKGTLRDFEQVDTQDADEMHGPLKYIEVRDLLRGTDRTRPKLLYAHGITIASYLRHQALLSADVYNEYSNLLGMYPASDISGEEMEGVEEYIRTH